MASHVRRRAYCAVLTPVSSGGYNVRFPDLPGTLSSGSTVAEAALNSQECLALHIFGMEEEGYELPEPTPQERIELASGELAVLVSVDLHDYFPDAFPSERRGGRRAGAGRVKGSGRQASRRLLVKLTEEEETALESLARASGQTKSDYVRSAIVAACSSGS